MFQRIRVLIADDESLGRSRLRQLLERDAGIEVVGESCNGEETVLAIETERPDLVFLDVQMPELDGVAVVEAIGVDRFPAVVFVTAHHEYMERAFELHALDYLRKPYTDARFASGLQHAKERVHERWMSHHDPRFEGDSGSSAESRLGGLIAQVNGAANRDRRLRVIGKSGVIQMVRLADVEAIEAANDHVKVHTGRDTLEWRMTLTEAVASLDPTTFLRVHRSSIINRNRVRAVRPIGKGEFFFEMESGRVVGSGRTFRGIVERFVYAGI